jgi:hypothetical protein
MAVATKGREPGTARVRPRQTWEKPEDFVERRLLLQGFRPANLEDIGRLEHGFNNGQRQKILHAFQRMEPKVEVAHIVLGLERAKEAIEWRMWRG